MTFEPGIPTAVPGTVSMLGGSAAQGRGGAGANARGGPRGHPLGRRGSGCCEVAEEPIWRIQLISLDPERSKLAREACERVTGTAYELPQRRAPRC